MRPYTNSIVGLLALCLVALTGCQKKLNYEKDFTLTAGENQAFPVDAPKSDQQLSVTVTASGSPVNVLIVLESDHAATMDALTNLKKIDKSKALASKDKVENDTLEATAPAGKGFSVFISGATKKTDVKLKITGR